MKLIGKPCKRPDGLKKVNGKAVYGNDLKLPGMLYAACRYSDIAAGKIVSIDMEIAENDPAVKAIAGYNDIPGTRKIGPIRDDYLPLIKDEVFFRGDVIAVVAAESREAALAAAEKIDVEYTPLVPVTNPLEAVKPETRLVHPEYKSNIVNHYPLRKGDLEKGFQNADHTIIRTYRTGFQEHAYLEPETVTVAPDIQTGGFKVYGSIQNPYTTRKVVAMFMNLDLNRINVLPSELGGSFGGKDDVINNMACRTALLCKITGKPVQMTNSREISIRESYKRHPYILNYKAGFKKDGRLTALEIDLLADSGAYSSQSFFVTWRSVVQAAGPYAIENIKTDIRAVYTNNPYTAAFRGFGSPQVIFAQESLMDEIASICGISPQEVRFNNALQQDSITATGQRLSSHKVSLSQVIKTAVQAAGFENKYKQNILQNKHSTRFKRGIGLACSFRGCSLGAEGTDVSSAIVSVQADASIILFTGVSENGQGLQTTMSLIAAEELGVSIDRIVFLDAQTSIIADGGPTVASRGTIAGGNAVKLAAEKIRQALFPVIREQLQVNSGSELSWSNGEISSKNGKVSFSKAVEQAFQKGINLSAYGWFKAPEVSWNEETGQGNAYFTYVYGCQIAEVNLDSYTGKITVEHIWAAHDAGRVINLLGAEGQIYGGVIQGMGYALMEDLNCQKGKISADNFDSYLIPGIEDIPEITPLFVENPDPAGPLGAKSLGEPTFELISAAINNACFNATGSHATSLPLSLEEMFLKKKLYKPERQSQSNINSEKFHHQKLSFSSITANDLTEALQLIATKDFKILAGGTDLIIGQRNSETQDKVLNIKMLSGLQKIIIAKNEAVIGSGVTFSQLLAHNGLKDHFPLLFMACSQIGSTQIRNVATIGGNIVNAAPCADSVPPLILYEAVLDLRSQKSKRSIPVYDFIRGSYRTGIKKDEILTAIHIPLPEKKKYFHHYYQLGRRKALNITRLSIASRIEFDKKGRVVDIRIAAGSLLPRPSRLDSLENLILDRKIDEPLLAEVKIEAEKIIKDQIGNRWSAEYKIPVFINLLTAALNDIKEKFREYYDKT